MPSHARRSVRVLRARPLWEQRAKMGQDDALMAQAAAGDSQAFAALVAANLPQMLALSRRLLGDEDEAEDVAQEAFLRLWRQAPKWERGRARVSTWLYRVTYNLCVDRLRSRRPNAPLEAANDQPQPADQLRAVAERELGNRVEHALDRLPPRQKTALILFHYQGLSLAEVAAVLQVSVEAVESLLARARRKLKNELAPEWKALLPDGETQP